MTTMQSSRPAEHRYLPRLQPGDRLTSAEFERRYLSDPEVKRAELIEGVVYVTSPVRLKEHAEPHVMIVTWLGVYAATHPRVRAADNATMHLDPDNNFQPDVVLRYLEGGTSRVVDGYLEGPPELVVEVSASTVSIDLHAKKHVYRRSGVAEYVVWRVEDGAVDWFVLQEGEYVPLEPDENGVFHSRVFPGLRLAFVKLIEGDLAGVLAAQQTPPTAG